MERQEQWRLLDRTFRRTGERQRRQRDAAHFPGDLFGLPEGAAVAANADTAPMGVIGVARRSFILCFSLHVLHFSFCAGFVQRSLPWPVPCSIAAVLVLGVA